MTDPFALENPGLRATIGLSRFDITPPVHAPINNWASGPSGRASGVHLPLTGTAMYLEQEGEVLLLVSLDLGWWRTDDAIDALRTSLSQRFGVEPSHVAICLTHTHAGPAVDPVAVGTDEASDVRTYLRSIAAALVQAAEGASANATPALLEWGRGRCELAHVRDQWSESEARYVCGFEPELSADHTLLVGRVVDESGTLRGLVVNYACHPTSLGPGNTLLSPDYVGVARGIVEPVAGAPMLFVQGASGELAPRRQYDTGTSAVTSNGEEFGYAVLATLAGMLPPGTRLQPQPTVESGAPLGRWELRAAESVRRPVAAVETRVPLPPNSQAGAWRHARGLNNDANEERRARQALVVGSKQAEADFPVTVWRLGPSVLVAHPGEAYSDLQTELRALFPRTPIVVANLANGRHRGYLPPAAAYASERYQVWQTPLGRGSLKALIQHCARQISRLNGERTGSTAEDVS